MREILFRGQAKNDTYRKDGDWIYSSFIMQDPKTELLSHQVELFDGSRWVAIDPETVGQYTGLTANGTKIFEGDIMPVYEQGMEYYYKVVYNGDCFMLAMLDSEQGSYPLSVKNTISKIIGNIHDNPELLEGGMK